MRTYVGIDPGASGALAYKNSTGEWGVYDLPVVKTGKQKHMDAEALKDLITTICTGPDTMVLVEQQNPTPVQGVVAAGQMMLLYGQLVLMLDFFGVKWDVIRPSQWKKAMGLTFRKGSTSKERKDASMLKARQLYGSPEEIRLAKHHDRAEAMLLAEQCRRMYGGQ